jgi:hypothetical protein
MFKQISVAQSDLLLGAIWTDFCHGVSVLANKDVSMSVKDSARWCLSYLFDAEDVSRQRDIEKIMAPIQRVFLNSSDTEPMEMVLVSLRLHSDLYLRRFGVIECKIPLPVSADGSTFVNTCFPPSVFLDFPINPHLDIVKERALRFARTHGLYGEKFPDFQEMKIAHLCGFAYSTPSFLYNAEKLSIAADWATVLHHHTDAVDGFLGSRDENVFDKLRVINDRLLAIIKTPLHEFDFLDELAVSPRERALVDVYTRLVSHLNILEDSDLLPLRVTFEDYLRATEWACHAREIRMTYSFHEYQWRRKDLCGAQSLFAVGLLMIGVPKLMDHTVVRSLAEKVCDSIGTVSDMYSFWQTGSDENELKLRISENRLSLKDAFLACERDHSTCVMGINELTAVLIGGIDLIAKDNSSAEEGVRFIQNWALANIKWAAITGRYAIGGKSTVA